MKKVLFLISILAVFGFVKSYSQIWEAANKDTEGKAITNPTIIKSSGNSLFLGSSNGLYKSTDFGGSWSIINSGLPNTYIADFEFLEGQMFVLTYSKGVYFTNDNANSWFESNSEFKLPWGTCITNVMGDIYVGDNTIGIFLSTDNGKNWSDIGISLPGKDISCITASDDKIFVGTTKEGIFYTSDKGNSWNSLNVGINETWITSIIVVDEIVFVGTRKSTSGGIYYLSEDGLFWSKINNELTNTPITALYSVNDLFFAGSDFGKVIYSKDKGKNWIATSDNLPASDIKDIFMLDNYIFCNVFKNGVFKIDATPINVEDKIFTDVMSIYPNPTSDYIIINPRDFDSKFNHVVDEISIQIYNSRGEKMLSVVTSSDISIQINISDLPKGRYFVKVGSETAKFIKM